MGQMTPNSVALHLASLARDLDITIAQLESADREAAEKRGAFDLAYSRSFLAAQGSMDIRKHEAVVETHDKRMSAEVADALVRHLRRRADAIKVQVECGRSMNSALKTEMNLAGQGD